MLALEFEFAILAAFIYSSFGFKNFEVPISVGTFSFLAPSIRSELFYTVCRGAALIVMSRA